MIDLGRPELLLLLLVVVAMATASLWLARWRHQARASFAGPQAVRWPRAAAWPQALLLLVAAALIAVAAARPQWGSREVSRERRGIDLVIALDISQSMQAQDVAPSRLGLAQQEIERLIEAAHGDRFGLVFFAGTAISRSPLTTDTQAMVQLVRRADREGGLARAGSDLAAALDQALLILTASETAGKAVLVVSDGEDHAGSYPARLPALRERGISVFTAGVGTPSGTTLNEPDPRTGQPRLKLDGSGSPVISRLQESSLQSIAQGANGRYLHLTPGRSLAGLAGDLDALEQTPLGAEIENVPLERFQWFAAASFALLALAWLLPERLSFALPRPARLRPGVALLIVALLAGACGGESLRDKNASANRLYGEGNYEGALAAYQELLAERPDLPQLSFNAGNALHRLGRYARAGTETQRALPPTNRKLGAATYYALGNHYFALDELEQAYTAYRNTLILDPSDGDAKFNLELTLLRLQSQQAEQQPGGGTPDPGTNPQDGTPPPGATPSPADGQPAASGTPTAEQLRRSLEEALRGIDEQLTYEEAVQILDLLRQQQQRQQTRPGPVAPAGPDY